MTTPNPVPIIPPSVARCRDPTQCPNGNCPGCFNGKVWCCDPQCYPSCPSCNTNNSIDILSPDEIQPCDTSNDLLTINQPTETWKTVLWFALIIFVGILLFIIVWYMIKYFYRPAPPQLPAPQCYPYDPMKGPVIVSSPNPVYQVKNF